MKRKVDKMKIDIAIIDLNFSKRICPDMSIPFVDIKTQI
jgi:hypothetical protein